MCKHGTKLRFYRSFNGFSTIFDIGFTEAQRGRIWREVTQAQGDFDFFELDVSRPLMGEVIRYLDWKDVLEVALLLMRLLEGLFR